MAFQQPQHRPQPSRQLSPNKLATETISPASPVQKRQIEESQEWILFSPVQNEGESHTSQTPRTATQLSEFGSLETHVRSQPPGERHEEDAHGQGADGDDDGAELDSLDDGLHAFHHHPFSAPSNNLDVSGGTVLPTHDGFGTFPSSSGLQQQLWQFERYNPQRKRHLRRSSVQIQLDAMEEEQERDVEDDRTARIEQWRLDQSRAVLDEIEKETRRRRRRISRMSGASASTDVRTSVRESAAARAWQPPESAILEEPEAEPSNSAEQEPESFWQRITRKVIRDLIGLDESTLAVIFGEALPEESSPTPTRPSPIAAAVAAEPRQSRVAFNDSGYSWEVKLLNHIARELGLLVNQLIEHDGRAFTTYLSTREESDYAGLPLRDPPAPRQPSLRQKRRLQTKLAQASVTDAMFPPTLSRQQPPLTPSDAVDTSLWGIEEEPDEETAQQLQQDREYWERDIDVNMIFSYLKNRFAPRSSQPEPSASNGPLPASWATFPTTASALGTSPESQRRAEMIRRQHPLVSRAAAAQSRRRESLLRSYQLQTSTALKRPGESSSCASQSTKRSRHSRSGSSRHYWDLGGSIDSLGSGAASAAVGGWGDV